MNYLAGYPPHLVSEVESLAREGRLGDSLRRRYPQGHAVQNDGQLYDYVAALKSRHLRNADAIAKVAYDPRLHIAHNALGTLTSVSRVQGTKLKAKREIRVASLFKQAPAPFLRMIVVHELAHLKEREHGKAFYALCSHIEPDYHQIEFDTRVWLTWLDSQGIAASPFVSAASR